MIKQVKITTSATYTSPGPDFNIGDHGNSSVSDPTKIIELHFANLTVDATGAKQVTVSFDGVTDAFTIMPAGCSGRAWLQIYRCLGFDKIWVKGVSSAVVEITAIT